MKLKNQKKTISPEIMHSLKARRRTLKKYKVKKIGLFGSFARGEQRKGSDLDFLVEFDLAAFGQNYEGYFDNYMGLHQYLEKIFGRQIDLLTEEMISPHIKPYILPEVESIEAL